MRFLPPPHDDGFEILGAHQTAHAAPAGHSFMAPHAGGDARKAHAVLARRADAGNLGLGICFSSKEFDGFKVVFAPEMLCGADLDLARPTINPQIDRFLGPPGEDQPVVAGEAEFSAPVAAHVGLVPDAG